MITATREKNSKKHRNKRERCCKHSPRKIKNGDTLLGYSGRTALRRELCGGMPKTGIVEF
jgi:hypothetical protein